MKISVTFILFAFLLPFLIGCKEDIPASNQFEESPIVVAILDPSEEYHYIKVQRAFIGPGNTFEIAKIEDSLYHQSVDGSVIEIGGLGRVFVLRDTTLAIVEPGNFAAPNVRLQYFKTDNTTTAGKLNNNATYKLDLNINSGKFKVTGTTAMVKDVQLTSPSSTTPFTFKSANGNFAATSIAYNEGTAAICDVRVRITLREFTSSVLYTEKTADWKISEVSTLSTTANTNIVGAPGTGFYPFVGSMLTNDNSIIKRNIMNLDIVITGASSDLERFILINKPASSLAQTKPIYTNLVCLDKDGLERKVIGIIASRNTLTYIKKAWELNPSGGINKIGLSKESMAELLTNPATSGKGFCSSNPDYISTATIVYCP